MKIQILIPFYKIVDVPCVVSLSQLILELSSNGHSVYLAYSNGVDVTEARNSLFKSMKDEIDYVLMIDSDMVYRAEDFHKLIAVMNNNNLQMLSAKYYIRSITARKLAMLDKVGDAYDKILEENSGTGIRECAAVGLGFCVLKSSLVEEIQKLNLPRLFEWNKFGEDVHFCNIVKSLGHKICFDNDTVVGHITSVVNK